MLNFTQSPQRTRPLLAPCAALLLSASLAIAVVCRMPGIQGFEESASRAHRLLPPNTTDPAKTVLYIERTRDGYYYYHSNFITEGAENPTKIAEKTLTNVRQAFLNILYAERPDALQRMQTDDLYKNDLHVILDASVFTEGGYPSVDVGDATHIQIQSRSSTSAPVLAETLNRTSPPRLVMSKVSGCCLYGIPPHLAPTYESALKSRPLDTNQVRFLSLVRDYGTEAAIRDSTLLSRLRLGKSDKPFQTLAQIEDAFQTAQGKTVIMVSHVEGSNFVIRDPARNVTLSVPIESVRELAKKYNVELVDLGCQTAKQIAADSLNLGVTTRFNTVEATKSLHLALSQSTNYHEFLQSLASQNLKLVIDRGFVRGWPLCGDIYAPTAKKSVWVKIARIFVSFRDDNKPS